MFDRTISLIGIDNLNKIKEKNILVIGVGGVGGYAIEALIRSGVESITIVDYDTINLSNINRQIISDNNNIGKYKVDEFEKRILAINPNIKVVKIKEKIDENNINILFQNNYDYIIDACDTMIVKKLLISKCHDMNIKLITVCGMGKKLDPSKITICDIRDTSYDPLAKALRKYVKDNNIKGKVPCICSSEKPNTRDNNIVSSMIMVPSVAGIYAASYVINDIIKENK